MRRETRVNFIFLTLFIVITLPGAVILFRKKLDPTAHRLDQPDPVLNRLPYMAPLPAPPGVKWIVPDRAQAWVESLTAPVATVSAGPPGPQWDPVISDDHILQVLVASRDAAVTRVTLLVWRGDLEPKSGLFTVMIDGLPGARIVAVKAVAIPPDVRRELVVMGIVRPPETALRVDLECRDLPAVAIHRLELSYHGLPGPIRATVDFPLK